MEINEKNIKEILNKISESEIIKAIISNPVDKNNKYKKLFWKTR